MNEVTKAASRQAAKPFPRFWPSIGWILVFFMMQAVCGIAAGKLYYPDLDAQSLLKQMADLKASAVPIIWSMLASGIITTALLGLYLSRKQRYRAIGLDRWSEIDAVRTTALAVGLVLLGYAINYVYAAHIIQQRGVQGEMHAMFAAIPQTPLNTVMIFAAVAIIAPAVEELIFRGMLQKSIANRLGPFAGITLASLIFAVGHMQPMAFVPLVVLGAIFGYLYHRTGSMRVNILLHIINNALALMFGS